MKQIIEYVMSKQEIMGRTIKLIDDRKTFERMSMNGRYSIVNQKKWKEVAKKYSREADLMMALTYRWSTY